MTAVNAVGDYDAWLAVNTAYCQRHRTRLTPVACYQNQDISAGDFGDLRCQGCTGLDNQPEETKDPLKLNLAYPHQVELDQEKTANKCDEPEEVTGGGVRIAEATGQKTGLDLDETELDELLAELFPEDDDCEDEEQRAVVYLEDLPEAKGRRVRVYMGRCTRCGGYMTNDRERQFDVRDEDVYRCCSCGWRTSPCYAINRDLTARGLEV